MEPLEESIERLEKAVGEPQLSDDRFEKFIERIKALRSMLK